MYKLSLLSQSFPTLTNIYILKRAMTWSGSSELLFQFSICYLRE